VKLDPTNLLLLHLKLPHALKHPDHLLILGDGKSRHQLTLDEPSHHSTQRPASILTNINPDESTRCKVDSIPDVETSREKPARETPNE